MKRGFFNYKQQDILYIASEIQHILDIQGKPVEYKDMTDDEKKMYLSGEEIVYDVLPEDVEKIFKKAVYYLHKAYKYIDNIDAYLNNAINESKLKENIRKNKIEI